MHVLFSLSVSPFPTDRYVKYLYPYECEVEKLSDPQDLQLAIDSNKRDRRHSETVEFIAPQITTCRPGELEPGITSPVTHVTAPQGLQIIGSPTVALPHGSIPPYSGGFIVTPGGAHVMAPSISSRGQPQLLHMSPHGIPIMMPTQLATRELSDTGSNEDGDDLQDSIDDSQPPLKKIGLDPSQGKMTSQLIASLPPHTTSFLMAPSGGGPLVQVPHGLTSHSPQFIQMAHHPFVIPTTAGSFSPTERWSEKDSERLRIIQQPPVVTRENVSMENGIPSHTVSGMVLASGPRGTHLSSPRLVQLSSPHLPNMPVMMSTLPSLASQQGTQNPGGRLERKMFEQLVAGGGGGEERKPTIVSEREKPSSLNSKVSFANISIQSGNRCYKFIHSGV